MSLSSMTAFSRLDYRADWGVLHWELRSVNHRYLDVTFKTGEALRYLEHMVRERVKQQLGRGKVDVLLQYQFTQQVAHNIVIDHNLVGALLNAQAQVNHQFAVSGNFDAVQLLRWPGVVQEISHDVEQLETEILQTLDKALSQLLAMRHTEGEAIKRVLLERIEQIEAIVASVQTYLPPIQAAQRDKLKQRMDEAGVQYDAERLEQELVLWAQKIDVFEELDRLLIHCTSVREILTQGGVVGRRLDFVVQELHREANTLGSKSVDSKTTQAAVDLKVLIEQLREQVQNIE
jgi:uncharacterized protein (TIGR00255 family)